MIRRILSQRLSLLFTALTLVACGKHPEDSEPANAEKQVKNGPAPGARSTAEQEQNAAEAEATSKPPQPIDRAQLAVFKPLPANFDSASNPPTPAKLHLGHMLFFDPRLSRSGKISCNSCHNLATYGVDYESTSPGHAGKRGDRNSPTVFNAAGHFRQFWDGRAADVEAQAKGPVLNPIEHGIKDAAEVTKILSAIPGYVAQFQRAFPKSGKQAVSFDHFAQAIGAFERKLVTPAPWDKFLGGDDTALTREQQVGARLFVEIGCIACHNGPLLGGSTYQLLGKVKPWPRPADPGRKQVTGKAEDLHKFKVPSLRNVAKTMPYFHDGKTMTLGEAVKLMATHQLGRSLDDAQVALIVTFLDSLTGEVPGQWTQRLVLPPSMAPADPDKGAPPVRVKKVKKGSRIRRADVVLKVPSGPGSAPPPPLPPADHVAPPADHVAPPAHR